MPQEMNDSDNTISANTEESPLIIKIDFTEEADKQRSAKVAAQFLNALVVLHEGIQVLSGEGENRENWFNSLVDTEFLKYQFIGHRFAQVGRLAITNNQHVLMNEHERALLFHAVISLPIRSTDLKLIAIKRGSLEYWFEKWFGIVADKNREIIEKIKEWSQDETPVVPRNSLMPNALRDQQVKDLIEILGGSLQSSSGNALAVALILEAVDELQLCLAKNGASIGVVEQLEA